VKRLRQLVHGVRRPSLWRAFGLFAVVTSPVPAQGQVTQLTADDYARAERFLSTNTSSLVYGSRVDARWLDDGRFWYRNAIARGSELVVVDPTAATKERIFAHDLMAAALSGAAGSTLNPLGLPIVEIEFEGRDVVLELYDSGHFRCTLVEYTCEPTQLRRPPVQPDEVPSPDGRSVVFIREHNLWVRDRESGAETQLTTDGVEDFNGRPSSPHFNDQTDPPMRP
jgi:dipeptidyl-peptidase-4